MPDDGRDEVESITPDEWERRRLVRVGLGQGQQKRWTLEDARKEALRLAREACDKHKDIERSRDEVIAGLESDRELYDTLTRPMFIEFVNNLIYDVRHQTLRTIRQSGASVGNPCERDVKVIAGAAAAVRSFLDLWPMPNGKPLGDTTGAELKQFAIEEGGFAKTHAAKAKFYAELAATVPGEKSVRDVVTAQATEGMWTRIRDGVNGVFSLRAAPAA